MIILKCMDMFFLWENYTFIDFYNIPHIFTFLDFYLEKFCLERDYVCVRIIYTHMQLYHAMLFTYKIALSYPLSGPSSVTISLFLYCLQHVDINFLRTAIIMNTLKIFTNLNVSTNISIWSLLWHICICLIEFEKIFISNKIIEQ